MSLGRRLPPTADAGTTAPPHAAEATGPNGGPQPAPGFRGPLESTLRHPLLVLLPLVLLVGAAIAVSLLREPVYTAEARVTVGRTDVPAYTLQEVTIGNATLAASYARAVDAPSVIAAGARAAGITEEKARENLRASQVPRSTLIRVEAVGDSAKQAQDLATGAARGLVTYVRTLNVRQQDRQLVQRYRAAQRRTDAARRRFRRLQRGGASRSRVQDARLDLLTAQLRSQTLSTRVVQNSATPAQNTLQLVVPAATSDSDRGSVLSRLLLIGAAAGLLLGIALALLRANADLLRDRRTRLADRRG